MIVFFVHPTLSFCSLSICRKGKARREERGMIRHCIALQSPTPFSLCFSLGRELLAMQASAEDTYDQLNSARDLQVQTSYNSILRALQQPQPSKLLACAMLTTSVILSKVPLTHARAHSSTHTHTHTHTHHSTYTYPAIT